jgi:hypothetical protein
MIEAEDGISLIDIDPFLGAWAAFISSHTQILLLGDLHC